MVSIEHGWPFVTTFWRNVDAHTCVRAVERDVPKVICISRHACGTETEKYGVYLVAQQGAKSVESVGRARSCGDENVVGVEQKTSRNSSYTAVVRDTVPSDLCGVGCVC